MIPCPAHDRKRIAIVTSFFRHGQWRGMMRYGQSAGWICQRYDRESIDRLIAWNPDGILFQVDEFDHDLRDYILNSKKPKVGLRALPGYADTAPLILPDLSEFGRQIAKHLHASNYRRLCYLGPLSDHEANVGNTHVQGMQEIADHHQLTLECYFPDSPESWKKLGLVYRPESPTGWERFWEMGPVLIQHLLQDPEPVGVFFCFVEPAMEFMEMMRESPMPIPSRIGMVAQTEDALTGTVTKIPLSCLVPAYENQGYEAAALLDQILSGKKLPGDFRQFVSSCEIVLRESSNKIVTSDDLVRRMLDHIQEHSCHPQFSPDSLAEAFDYSLRSIQMRFHRFLGRGVAEVIRDYRTRQAIKMIRTTSHSMQEIMNQCGFANHQQLARSIRKHAGISPSAIRKNG